MGSTFWGPRRQWKAVTVGLPAEAIAQYDVENVQIPTKTIFNIPGQVSDTITFIVYDEKKLFILKKAIDYSRAIKTPYEIALIQKASAASSNGWYARFTPASKYLMYRRTGYLQ